jgi:hypothetical protein
MDSVPQHQVENRARLAVMMKRRLGGVEFDYFFGVAVFELDSQFRHRTWVVFRDYVLRRDGETAASTLKLPRLHLRRIFAII